MPTNSAFNTVFFVKKPKSDENKDNLELNESDAEINLIQTQKKTSDFL